MTNKLIERFSEDIKKIVDLVRASAQETDSRFSCNSVSIRITTSDDDMVTYFKIEDLKDYIVNTYGSVDQMPETADIRNCIEEIPHDTFGIHHYFERNDYKDFRIKMNAKYHFTPSSKTESIQKTYSEFDDDVKDIQKYSI